MSGHNVSSEGSDNIIRIFRSTSITMIVTEITGIVAVLIDGIITSRFLGVDAYSAISLLRPFTSIILVLAGFFSTGCNIVCSGLVGSGKRDESNEAFNLTVFLTVLSAGLLVIFSLAAPETLLRLCGISLTKYPELNPLLFRYLSGYLIGIPAYMLAQVSGPVLVMDSGKRLFRRSVMVLCVTNILGDLINIFVFHGGVFGMGITTSLSYIAQAVVIMQHFTKRSRYFHLSWKAIRWNHLPRIARNGTTPLTRKLSVAVRDIVLNYLNIMAALTSAAIAARGITSDLFVFLFCISNGLGRTLVTMVGIYYSANDLKGLTRLYSYSVKLGSILSAGAGAAVFLLAPQLVVLYTGDPEVIGLTVFSIRWMAAALIFNTWLALLQQYMQGIGKLKEANLLGLFERFLAPVLCALVLGLLFGSKGILISVAVSKIIMIAAVFIWSIIHCRRMPKEWADVMFLPKDFGGRQSDNMYAQLRSKEDVLRVCQKTEIFCLSHGVDKKEASKMALFLEEMGINVFEHAEKKQIQEVCIDYRLFINKGRICFSMMDLSEQFDPTLFYELHSDEYPEAHLGIMLVNTMAKEIHYFSTFNSNNLTVCL